MAKRRDQLARSLAEGKAYSSRDIYFTYRYFRSAGAIAALRAEGHIIECDMTYTKDQDGNPMTYGTYYIKPENRENSLKILTNKEQ